MNTAFIAAIGAAIALGWALPALAADFEVPFDLPTGSKLHIDIAKTGEQTRNGQSMKVEMSFRYVSELVSTDEGYVVTQTLVDSKLPTEAAQAAGMLAAARRIVFEADEDLTPIKVRDQQALVDAMVASLIEMLSKAEAPPPGAAEALSAQMKAVYGAMSPEAAAASFLKEFGLLAAPQLLALDVNDPFGGDFEVPNPFGGATPIKRTQTYVLKSMDKTAQRAVIEFTDRIDSDGLKAAILPLLDQLAPDAPKPTPEEIAALKIEQSTTCRYEMDTATGLTAGADCTVIRSAVGDDGKPDRRVERTVMSQRLERP